MTNPATGPLPERGGTSLSRSSDDMTVALLATTLDQLRQQTDLAALWPLVIDFLCQLSGVHLVWLATYQGADQSLQGQGGQTAVGTPNFLKQRFPATAGGLLDQVIMQKHPVSVPDLQAEPRAGEWCRVAKKLRIQGTVVYPIGAREDCLGLVLIGSNHWGEILRGQEQHLVAILLSGLTQEIYRLRASLPRSRATAAPQAIPAAAQLPLVSDLPPPLDPSPPPLDATLASQLLQEVSQTPTVTARIDALLQRVHQALQPAHTSLFTWQAETQDYVRRRTTADKPLPRENERKTVLISAQVIPAFCQTLRSGQVVAISDAHSLVSSQSPIPLLQLLKATAILAAPVILGEQLWGFLIADMPQSRIWSEAERQMLRVAAQFVALFAPVEMAESKLAQAEAARELASGLTQAICSDQDWQGVLRQACEQLVNHLQAQATLLVRHDPDTGTFTVVHQYPLPRGRAGLVKLAALSSLDWRNLSNKPDPEVINDLAQDLRLISWHQALLSLHCPAWLVISTQATGTPNHFLLIGRNTGSAWLESDLQSAQIIARQLGVLTQQWQLQQQTQQQQHLYQALQRGLVAIQKTQNLERLELASIQNLMELLQAPLVALITWQPGQTQGWIIVPPQVLPKFSIRANYEIDINRDPLIQAALEISQADASTFLNHPHPYPEVIQLGPTDLAPETREWLTGQEIGQVLAMALRTDPEYQPSGVIIVADRQDRSWPPAYFEALITLVNHLAYAHRSISLSNVLIEGWQRLEMLNWYKHRRIENLYRDLGGTYQQLYQGLTSHPPVAPSQLARTGQQFQSQLTSLVPLLQQEAWELKPTMGQQQESLGLSTLLRRSLERIESLVKQKQLWTQVHNPEMLSVTGDIAKIDLVLQELLLCAAQRSQAQGRIDIWCQAIDSQWLELSITDDGQIDPRLLIDLHHREHLDWLAPSTLDQPPGRHLRACFGIVAQLGATLDLYKLEDDRVLSRLILPLQVSA
ncbi:GAF domain-containing protein [Thermosynechococcaceae cyanobacterium BACA0444]|uniref:GAF domain-containing protein n=1 Tax=Pseudocalidococcus azoricus BACA0444 TaxID=2918990 RepID=A0AAE4FTA5_9CYAN|nr:GAF domain-containing protein [Pseudocalidococcus azoricus]MDS3861918.1 GAF domain-containing protein [Pseudocalidococcus azoricus BACA0444]